MIRKGPVILTLRLVDGADIIKYCSLSGPIVYFSSNPDRFVVMLERLRIVPLRLAGDPQAFKQVSLYLPISDLSYDFQCLPIVLESLGIIPLPVIYGSQPGKSRSFSGTASSQLGEPDPGAKFGEGRL